MNRYHLEAIHIRKLYPGTVALNDVSIGFQGGEVHALIGKNGAGKSTLARIFSGATQPTSGTILIAGGEVRLRSPRDAIQKGIFTVYQDMSLVPSLSVGENILLGRLPKMERRGRFIVDWNGVWNKSAELLENIRVHLDVRLAVGSLSVAQQQLVEIAKAMACAPSVLILDEPTSALAHDEAQNLFQLVRQLAGKNVAIIYISHRLQELKEIADVISVLRDGELVGTIQAEEATPDRIARMMFGETVQKARPTDLQVQPEGVLEVRHLSRRGRFEDISFTLQKGEVLGLAGMVGSGRTELLRAIMGADPFDGGEIWVGNRKMTEPTPARMKRFGLGLTPENRKEEGLVQVLSTRDNLCLASLGRIAIRGLLWPGRQRKVAARVIQALSISVADIDQSIATLSGGNQQKVVVGNWLNTEPRIMFFDEPTRGVDVQAKQQIFQIIWNLSKQGISSIFVSSELEELIEVCHRLLIMRRGRIIGEVSREGMKLERLLELCM